MIRKVIATVALVAALCPIAPHAALATGSPSSARRGADDATVVAVIDYTFAPYHWDYLASKMPQALNRDPSDDLPLSSSPDKWLPGFPNPNKAFASYDALHLSLEEKNANESVEALTAKDANEWNRVQTTTDQKPHYYWIPDTKVIGAIDFAGNDIHGTPDDHGQGTTSVSIGNLHGTCPECLLVFLNISVAADAERAIDWAMQQPWIDAISNSYGFSVTPATRDRLYAGSDTELQKKASERGQTIFFSAGNGQENAFLIPNTTLLSSQEGPDWIVTVGAVSPGAHAAYTGAGKPADIAGIGSDYPAAYGSPTVGGTGSAGFGGTSNATPTIAGTYARALYLARRDLGGPSRIQRGGVIASGSPYRCGSARRDCELGDGKLTATELRRRLFLGATHPDAGLSPGGVGAAPPIGEDQFLAEGHGAYFARETGKPKDWLAEFRHLIGPLEGSAKEMKRPAGEREWMIVDSFCRQHLWGGWSGGYFLDGKTKLPGDDPAFPIRSTIERVCPTLQHGP
ncbi:MAG TPA: S8/S53 family peptidase [Actinomycetota bacterium]|nr:S8/S53 family peptidase [Actinomycetota bacterium]